MIINFNFKNRMTFVQYLRKLSQTLQACCRLGSGENNNRKEDAVICSCSVCVHFRQANHKQPHIRLLHAHLIQNIK